jgi:D-Tyr-tRNAtyr deacylase
MGCRVEGTRSKVGKFGDALMTDGVFGAMMQVDISNDVYSRLMALTFRDQ